MSNGKTANPITFRSFFFGVLVIVVAAIVLIVINNFMDNIKTKAEHVALTQSVLIDLTEMVKVKEILNTHNTEIAILKTQWADIQGQLKDINDNLKVLRGIKNKPRQNNGGE